MSSVLAAAGHELILYNRDTSKAEAVASKTGAMVASSPAEAAGKADVIITSLADDAAVMRAVLRGELSRHGWNVEAARDESFVHTHKIRLSPGRRKVGVAVLDVFGQQSSIVTGFVDVGGGD